MRHLSRGVAVWSLAIVLVAGPAAAQGRFGIRSVPRTPPPPGGYYVRRPPVYVPPPLPYVYGWGFGYRGWVWGPWWVQPVPVGPPTVVAPAPEAPPSYYPPDGPVDQDGIPIPVLRSVRRTTFTLTAEGQNVEGKGNAFGLGLGIESEHLGVLAQWNSFYLNSLDGYGTDNVNLVHLHLTYALLSGERGRFRLHLGGSGAFTRDLARVGPSVGVSLAMGVLGPIGVEGQVTYTPTPFVEFDAFAGGTVAFGPLALRAGYHWTYLDDRGLVDGISHSERYQGPWIGLALAL
jgi:hypothetical protein